MDRKTGRTGCCAFACALSLSLLPSGTPESPRVLFGDLFAAVQSARIYSDSKAFADAVPNSAPDAIMRQYRIEHPASPAALSQFVAAHFRLPPEPPAAPSLPAGASPPEHLAIAAHIDALWNPLTRSAATAPPYSSLLPLPEPYVVPGGRFRELYYWDSYFTMLGLLESGRRDLLADMVEDFAHLIDTYGHVPNGTRTYYLSRSQPPFFYAMVGLLSRDDDAATARYLPQLRREHAFWMQGEQGLRPGASHRRVVAMPDGSILNRYWDDSDAPRDESYAEDVELARASRRPAPELYRDIRAAAESGWDFGSRWFADGRSLATADTTQIIPVDLNSLLFGLENAIRAGCEHSGDKACALEYERRAAARRRAVDRYLWDPQRGAYLDYRWTRRSRVPRLSAAALYPLFVSLASASQAAAAAHSAARELLERGGLVTTRTKTGEQWDWPNGWAPLQWIAIAGLRGYGQMPLAGTVACRWMAGVNEVYRQDGKLVEKYDVVTPGRSGGGGEYPLQDGFGWTNGVMRKLIVLYPEYADLASPESCPKI
jgi:alpha,alpha-trehalase